VQVSREAAEKIADLMEKQLVPVPDGQLSVRLLMDMPEVRRVLEERRTRRALLLMSASGVRTN